MKAALIILVHDSVPFTVKAGKVDTISEQESLAMNNQLLQHTYRVTKDLAADKYVFTNEGSNNWARGNYNRRIQRGRDTGEKMMYAFQTVFSLGYSKAVMIGSAAIETDTSHLQHAFDYLDSYDVVIGPAQEGGYYLLGMKKLQSAFFKHKAWNTPVLLQQTLEDIDQLRLTYHLQQVLSDAEEEREKYLFRHRQ